MEENNSGASQNNLDEQPFTITVFGKTGTGKSTTLNALFGLSCKTDPSVACTIEPQIAHFEKGHHIEKPIRVVDMPGIGESIDADMQYLPYYEKWIPETHSLVWVTQADTRAYKRDEIFLNHLLPLLHPSLFFTVALNRIDHLGVDEGEKSFDITTKQPSQAQLQILPEKIDDVYRLFKGVLKTTVLFEKHQIVPYSAVHRWGLDTLKTTIFTRRETLC
ncbi:hypothetical protein U14_01845 [Candidatus Moduliflexus flocculans]|uniref:G domain-containing protein n=1 Tax=Candidatus Moduliflexus flocculans TaxID=1499966 RepID=A0A0S6VWK3_9BACT|nr:hypothetical protein U14_01845 [Candidatus Moduliflexus flocculans]